MVERPEKPSLEALTATVDRTTAAVRECTARKDKVVADARARLVEAQAAQKAGLDAGKGADRSLEVLAATQALQAAQDAADRLGPELARLHQDAAAAVKALADLRRETVLEKIFALYDAAEAERRAAALKFAQARGLVAAFRLAGDHEAMARIAARTTLPAPAVEAEGKRLRAVESAWADAFGVVSEGGEP